MGMKLFWHQELVQLQVCLRIARIWYPHSQWTKRADGILLARTFGNLSCLLFAVD